MQDPWWPGSPPPAGESAPVPSMPEGPAEPVQQGLPGILVPVLGLAWLACGPWFAAHADHFGPGMMPALLWTTTYPVAAVLQIWLAIRQVYRWRKGDFGARFRSWRLGPWLLAALGYIAMPIAIFLG
ncbi:hypothetical protein [Luteimonas kalidii]|uniref:Uncharacterized protein n=1 Tax=Luteimonas kalidii TaxID=3042025 RepID=A0ABT6JYJ9_9GAMM|nr:hypothetical protein [Luteimonas kalidii]MDH5835261.1 hypothetical protein [Luteimonas kalidii]